MEVRAAMAVPIRGMAAEAAKPPMVAPASRPPPAAVVAADREPRRAAVVAAPGFGGDGGGGCAGWNLAEATYATDAHTRGNGEGDEGAGIEVELH